MWLGYFSKIDLEELIKVKAFVLQTFTSILFFDSVEFVLFLICYNFYVDEIVDMWKEVRCVAD